MAPSPGTHTCTDTDQRVQLAIVLEVVSVFFLTCNHIVCVLQRSLLSPYSRHC